MCCARRCSGCSVAECERETFNPNPCGACPCILGMRIRVKDGLEFLAAKVPEEEILG
jgi:uncharacterized protein (DUF433 family)